MNQFTNRYIMMNSSYYRLLGKDRPAAFLLTQIVYWFSPAKNGKSKLRVERHGKFWVAKSCQQWMEECAITRHQYLRVLPKLKSLGIVEVRRMLFNGAPTNHIHLNAEVLTKLETETQQPV